MPLVVDELLTLPEHTSTLPDISMVRFAKFLVLVYCAVDYSFDIFLLIILLSIILPLAASEYPHFVSSILRPNTIQFFLDEF